MQYFTERSTSPALTRARRPARLLSHPAAQMILLETCKEFGVRYEAAGSAWSVYKEMIHSFANPRSLYKEILVYGGGL